MKKKEIEKLEEITGDYSWYYIDKLEPFIDQLIKNEKERNRRRNEKKIIKNF